MKISNILIVATSMYGNDFHFCTFFVFSTINMHYNQRAKMIIQDTSAMKALEILIEWAFEYVS